MRYWTPLSCLEDFFSLKSLPLFQSWEFIIDRNRTDAHLSGPHIEVPALTPFCQTMNVRIDYSAGRSTSQRDPNDWNGPDGMRDIGPPGNGNRVLLIRGFGPHTSQEELRDRLGAEIVRLVSSASGSSSSDDTVADGRPAIERVVLLRQRSHKTSTGLAFVQVTSPDLAGALLAHLLSREAQPVGFVVNDRPAACSFARPDSFVATADEKEPENTSWLIRASPDGGIGNGQGWIQYRDERLGASEVRFDLRASRMESSLKSYIASITPPDEADRKNKNKKEGAGQSAFKPLDRGASGITSIKMQPLKVSTGSVGKRKGDAMVALPIEGVVSTSGEPKTPFPRDFSIDGFLSGAGSANVLGQDDEEDAPAALPSKSRDSNMLSYCTLPTHLSIRICSLSWTWQTRSTAIRVPQKGKDAALSCPHQFVAQSVPKQSDAVSYSAPRLLL